MGNAGLVPQVLQQINYKEKKRMEGHSKFKETEKQLKMVKTEIQCLGVQEEITKKPSAGLLRKE